MMTTRDTLRQGEANSHSQIQQAASLRVSSLRTRIMALDAFCAVAQSELELNRLNKANRSMKRIRHAVEKIEHHLQEPQDVPADAAGELHALLAKTNPQIEKLENLLRIKEGR